MEKIFDIRYVKLHFTIEFDGDYELPKYKASALRGGMGEMLLRANCIKDRDCDNCDFRSECIVQRIMYSKMEIQPSFMSSGDSIGYVLECEDYRNECAQGDHVDFSLILFGKTICYFSQILNAFYALGLQGLGKDEARFHIVSVSNSRKQAFMQGNDITMSRYEVMRLSDYISYRREQIRRNPLNGCIKFQTPLTLKYRGKELNEFRTEAILEAVCRRIYMLDCFEGIESHLADRDYLDGIPVPEIIREAHRKVTVKRFSFHKNNAVYLEGIEGLMEMKEIPEDITDILLAGELIHIGKNTSFGFGRYRLL